MSLRAQIVIPVKGFATGKSRLSGALSEEDRADLLRRLTERTIAVAVSLPDVEVTVVSPDPDVLACAAGLGAKTLQQRTGGLNDALEDVIRSLPERRTLILPMDLPQLAAADIEAHIACDGVGVSPDARGEGTNLLSLPRPRAIAFRFGADSFRRHLEAVRDAGLVAEVVKRPGLAFDLDTPDDLIRLKDWP